MTKEEAIKVLEGQKYPFPEHPKDVELNTALDMAISALKGFNGMTNREALEILLPELELGEIHNGRHRFFLKGKEIFTFDLRAEVEWLNAPYQKGGE